MSGEQLKKKVESLGISQAEIARRLGVIPQSMTQYFKADDVRTGTLEKLCEVLGIGMGFFYNDVSLSSEDDAAKEELERLREENLCLREKLLRKEDLGLTKKESEVYNLWMEYMRITERMQDLYQKEKREQV